MTAAQRLKLMSVDEYLAAELDGEVRHEYLGGYVYAMAGAKLVHNQVATAFTTVLSNALSGTPCQPLNSDMKVRVQTGQHTRFYYPDGMVVCGADNPQATFQDQPIVLAEVLSESTRRIDEGEKCEAYLSIPSLRVYLLIETDSPRVVAHRRNPDGAFESEVYNGLDAVVPLPEIEADLPLAKLYERVEFSQASG